MFVDLNQNSFLKNISALTKKLLVLPKSNSPDINPWRAKAGAQILSTDQFIKMKTQHHLYIIGIMGFSGRWEKYSGLKGAELQQIIFDSQQIIREQFVKLQAKFGEKLFVCSGATNKGVLKDAYLVCKELGIKTLAVTPRMNMIKFEKNEIAQTDFMVVVGENWGDESPTFLKICDQFFMLGGGRQSRREALAGSSEGKPITIVRGFGGAADEITREEVPNATFVFRCKSYVNQ